MWRSDLEERSVDACAPPDRAVLFVQPSGPIPTVINPSKFSYSSAIPRPRSGEDNPLQAGVPARFLSRERVHHLDAADAETRLHVLAQELAAAGGDGRLDDHGVPNR